MRIQLKKTRLTRVLLHPIAKVVLALVALVVLAGLSVFGYYYARYAKVIDQRLSGAVFAQTSRIYSAPDPLFVGDLTSASEIVAKLQRAGYSDNKTNPMGWYHPVKGGLEIFPGPESYFRDEPVLVRLSGNKVERIVSLKDNTEQQRYELEPELITNLFDRSREKRRLVRFEDLPPHLVNAVLAAEDKDFFQHSGIDFSGIIRAAYEDIRSWNRAQGASTLTQQLSRDLFLTHLRGEGGIYERSPSRKAAETMIALQLEQRLTKQQIFEAYCNMVYLGQRGTFSLMGVGEASLAYFGKDVRQLSLPEAAFLAGITRGPNIYNPYKYPERARDRRNRILDAMVRIDAITPQERDEAAKAPINVVPPYLETGDAPYFVDLVREYLLERYPEKELVSNGYKIYTTLDMDLQRAAAEAVRAGMQLVDEQLAKRKSKKPWPQAQVALVSIDPRSGDVKALLGGRLYGASQLNRAVALRQPGSVFKPFVFAAAFNSAIEGGYPQITPATMVDDTPTVFVYEGGTYEPSNYRENFRGYVSARAALTASLNVATVKIAEMTGYHKVVQLARRAGLQRPVATPAVALGSYESSPLEMAGAYTIFANDGKRVPPFLVRLIRSRDGQVIEEHQTAEEQVLDPRVAALMTSLMEGVVQYGTGAGVRARGFTAPAAGKTGTSHDGWFAGYTSNLLTIVWVGFDDNTELPLSGSQSALPIWTEFMKRAGGLREYRNMAPFGTPPGLISVELDPESGQLATASCPRARSELFIIGSQPSDFCLHHSLQHVSQPGGPILPHDPFAIGAVAPPADGAGRGRSAAPVAPGRPNATRAPGAVATQPVPRPAPGANGDEEAADPDAEKKKKRGFFGRIFSVFGGDGDKQKREKQAPRE